ncbi:hypothetical protein HII36_24135 [Nonomuraea sp. NN258]|uniref:hypothetical protein n=1 Tax=Nonomuraea antri TaxID=2730852 RepID=UPI001569A68A|nr:hypothetical protein [Nonomuraea antri]NRQ34896.1 hypothetical protein [Nonomuraea antri]
MSLSDVIRNITKTVTNKDEFKEKAKDLPLLVIQTTLNAAGQALLLVDRVKNSIKGLGSKEEEREEGHDSRPIAAEQVAAPAEPAKDTKTAKAAKDDEAAEEEKPARREPVIFAPRPSGAEPNGVAKTKPDPVIFTPASKPEPAAPAETPEPAKAAEPVKVAEPAVAAEPVKAAEPAAAAEPVKAAEPVAVAVATELEEPLPGYAGLTVASLRARMRGKSEEQIAALLAYEQATTARPEVVRMFENRLAKLRAGE